jgi:hypothetical protein
MLSGAVSHPARRVYTFQLNAIEAAPHSGKVKTRRVVCWRILVKWSASFRFTLRIKVALFHCVVTPVSAIVRKLEMVFGSNESAYLRCLCYSRAVRSDCVCIALKHSSKKVRIRMSCSKRCKANYLWEPQRVVCYLYSARAILDPALRRSEASLQRVLRCHAENAPRVI